MSGSIKMQKQCDSDTAEQRWASEAAYFDAEEYSEGLIDPLTVLRYMECRKPFLPAELPYFLLGDVSGHRILEIGCGDGTNSILVALKGARTVGIDISSRAISIAKKRAEMHGVSEAVTFVCSPVEKYVPAELFDVIWGNAVLHHLIPVLSESFTCWKQLSTPEAKFLFVEPVSLSPLLRRLRLMLPIPLAGTPDERPLEPAELDLIRQHFSWTRITYFGALGRLSRFFVLNYEKSSWFKRALYDTLVRIDHFLLQTLGWTSFASGAVIEAKR